MSIVLDLVIDVFFDFFLVSGWVVLNLFVGFVDDDLYSRMVDEVVGVCYPEVERSYVVGYRRKIDSVGFFFCYWESGCQRVLLLVGIKVIRILL